MAKKSSSYKISWTAEGIQWTGDNTKEIADFLKELTPISHVIIVTTQGDDLIIKGAKSLGIVDGKTLYKGDYIMNLGVKGLMIIPHHGQLTVNPIKDD